MNGPLLVGAVVVVLLVLVQAAALRPRRRPRSSAPRPGQPPLDPSAPADPAEPNEAVLAPPRSAGSTVKAGAQRGLGLIGHLLWTVVAALVFFLVLTPLGLGARLLGLRLLPVGAWYARTPLAAHAERRSFVGARGGRGSAAAAAPRRSWRTGIALVAVGAIAATLLPRLLDRSPDESAVPAQLRGGYFDAFTSPALADASWKDEAGAEFNEVTNGQTYTSFVGNSLRDHEGRYVNVHNRERRSYVPAGDGNALDVWFFGSSIMFGFSAQRDLHTIPSEFARLAEADGIAVHPHNFGSPGYVNMQETVLAAQLLAAGQRPDLIVFYDGINDTAVQFQEAFGGIGTPGDPTDIAAYPYRRFLAGQLTGTDQPPATIASVPDLGRPPDANAVISALLDVYQQGIDLADALSDHYRIPVAHFWQPDLFNKTHLVPGEDVLVERTGLDQFEYEAISRISRSILTRLPTGVIDVHDAFDGTDEPVLTDQAHTNELGARLAAEAMYGHLAPELRTLDPP